MKQKLWNCIHPGKGERETKNRSVQDLTTRYSAIEGKGTGRRVYIFASTVEKGMRQWNQNPVTIQSLRLLSNTRMRRLQKRKKIPKETVEKNWRCNEQRIKTNKTKVIVFAGKRKEVSPGSRPGEKKKNGAQSSAPTGAGHADYLHLIDLKT